MNEQMTTGSSSPRTVRGFTLVELLVVMSIISLLAVVLLPQVTKIWASGTAADTTARILKLRGMIEKYAKDVGEFPPSDFGRARREIKLKADTTNMGIECLLIHLGHENLGPNMSLDDKAEWLGNTDSDDNGYEIPRMHTTKKLEVVDGWGNPLVYFHCDSYRKPQNVMMRGDEEEPGDEVTVRARKDGSGFVNPSKYQIISAGPDETFGTVDDICYPTLVVK